jgi:hypothetical protein
MYQRVRLTADGKHRKDWVELSRFQMYQTISFGTCLVVWNRTSELRTDGQLARKRSSVLLARLPWAQEV